ncbi:MAG: type II toxin-antitoxin system PemK/MazF family toxin [Planctomycetota bacterium]
MSAAPDNLAQRDIIWARVADSSGKIKERPLLILTATEEIILDQPFVALAISTTFPDPLPPNHVPLPWQADGKVRTGLRKRSAVVVDWQVVLRPSDVIERKGAISAEKMIQILECLAAVRADGDTQ